MQIKTDALDQEKIKIFIHTLLVPDNIVNITRLEEPEPENRKRKTQSRNFIVKNFPVIKDLPGQGTFICPNPLKPGTVRAEINLSEIKTIFIDFDNKDINLKKLPVQPNIISARSKKNSHIYYLIEPVEASETNIEKYKLIVQFFIDNFGADNAVKNPAGLIRLPGTVRYKDDKKEKYNYEILSTEKYTIDELIKKLGIIIPEKQPDQEKTSKTKKSDGPKEKIENFNAAEYVYQRNKKLHEVNKIQPGNGRSYKLLQIGYECRDWGIDKKLAVEIALRLNNDIFDHPEKEYIVKHQITSAYRYAKNEPGQRLKEFEEADDLKKQKKILQQYHEEERVREKLSKYVFILSAMRIVNIDTHEEHSSKEQISAFLLSTIGTTITFNAILIKNLVTVYDKMDFRPDIKKRDYKDEHGARVLNRFLGVPFEKIKSTTENKTGIDIFLNHLQYLTNTEYEYKTLLSYLVHNFQRPGVKIPYAPLLINRHTGTGRSWLGELMDKFLSDYTISVDHNNMRFGYTQYLVNRLFILIHEIKDSDKFSFMEGFKSRITEKKIYVEEKYARSYVLTDTVNYIFFSNHVDALKIDEHDRRLFVILNDKKENDAGYYVKLYSVLENIDQLTAIYNYLMSYDLTDFNPKIRPEMTEGKKLMLKTTASELSLFLEEMKEEHEIFKNEFILIRDIQNYIQIHGSEIIKRKVSEKQIKLFLINSGYYEKELNKRIENERIHRRVWVTDLTKEISNKNIIKVLGLTNPENMPENTSESIEENY